AVWSIFANKCRCCVNQNLRENFEVRNIWVRTHGKFEAVSHEKALFLILSCFWGSECLASRVRSQPNELRDPYWPRFRGHDRDFGEDPSKCSIQAASSAAPSLKHYKSI